MLVINDQIRIPFSEFRWTYVRASGPGGQNVNKVASKAVLRWSVVDTPSLPPDVKARLLTQLSNRLTTMGELVIASQRFRDQDKNRRDALERLRELIRLAAIPPKLRRPTRRTRGSKERRLEAKRHRSQTKSSRRLPDDS